MYPTPPSLENQQQDMEIENGTSMVSRDLVNEHGHHGTDHEQSAAGVEDIKVSEEYFSFVLLTAFRPGYNVKLHSDLGIM